MNKIISVDNGVRLEWNDGKQIFTVPSNSVYTTFNKDTINFVLTSLPHNIGVSLMSSLMSELEVDGVVYTSESELEKALNSSLNAPQGLEFKVVDELPSEGKNGVIYLIKSAEEGENMFEEWFYVDGKFELLGGTKVDLTNYYTKDEVDEGNKVNAAAFNTLQKSIGLNENLETLSGKSIQAQIDELKEGGGSGYDDTEIRSEISAISGDVSTISGKVGSLDSMCFGTNVSDSITQLRNADNEQINKIMAVSGQAQSALGAVSAMGQGLSQVNADLVKKYDKVEGIDFDNYDLNPTIGIMSTDGYGVDIQSHRITVMPKTGETYNIHYSDLKALIDGGGSGYDDTEIRSEISAISGDVSTISGNVGSLDSMCFGTNVSDSITQLRNADNEQQNAINAVSGQTQAAFGAAQAVGQGLTDVVNNTLGGLSFTACTNNYYLEFIQGNAAYTNTIVFITDK